MKVWRHFHSRKILKVLPSLVDIISSLSKIYSTSKKTLIYKGINSLTIYLREQCPHIQLQMLTPISLGWSKLSLPFLLLGIGLRMIMWFNPENKIGHWGEASGYLRKVPLLLRKSHRKSWSLFFLPTSSILDAMPKRAAAILLLVWWWNQQGRKTKPGELHRRRAEAHPSWGSCNTRLYVSSSSELVWAQVFCYVQSNAQRRG